MTSRRPQLLSTFSRFLERWADATRPVAAGDAVVLHRLDTAVLTPQLNDLFCAPGPGHVTDPSAAPVRMANQDVFDTDSLRNARAAYH